MNIGLGCSSLPRLISLTLVESSHVMSNKLVVHFGLRHVTLEPTCIVNGIVFPWDFGKPFSFLIFSCIQRVASWVPPLVLAHMWL